VNLDSMGTEAPAVRVLSYSLRVVLMKFESYGSCGKSPITSQLSRHACSLGIPLVAGT
jgi:hypothetical protein